MKIDISDGMKAACPDLKLLCMDFQVVNQKEDLSLIRLLDAEKESVRLRFQALPVSQLEAIDSARKIYRKLGKDPARYRVSSESLLRRVLLDKGLESVSVVVDCLNIASMRYGLSIGGYDVSAIKGQMLFDVGREDDFYEAVGRGPMNVTGLPVLRDSRGAFGSTTTDSERTKIDLESSHVIMNIISFNGKWLTETGECLKTLLETYAQAKLVSMDVIEV